MAVTKLMHMKEAPDKPHTHLKNSIDYILDVRNECEKTDFGRLTGSNCGTDAKSVLEAMLATKQGYGKTLGRQGYHFVIAFPPGVATPEQTLEAARMFCEIYLGDRYEYVYAVHTDTPHCHAHIVFNSVSVEDGLKYHYKKGDWGKYVQPVTNEVCRKMGLPELTVQNVPGKEPELTPRLNSYAKWMQENGGDLNRTVIFMADIDYAIGHSSNEQEFKENLSKMGYTMRTGVSEKYGKYIAYTFHYTDENGEQKYKSRRSYTLDKKAKSAESKYGPEAILHRIQTKEGPHTDEEVVEHLRIQTEAVFAFSATISDTRSFKRMYQAVSYYKLPNPYAVPAYKVRNDIIHMNKLMEECDYLHDHKFSSLAEMENYLKYLEDTIKEAEAAVRSANELIADAEMFDIADVEMSQEDIESKEKLVERLKKLDKEYDMAEDSKNEERMEEIQDEMELVESKIRNIEDTYRDVPDIDYKSLKDKRQLNAAKARLARKEKKILQRIIKSEKEQDLAISIPIGPVL